MSEEKKMEELDLEQLDSVAGGNLPSESAAVPVTALRNIDATDGPGEAGETLSGKTLKVVMQIPAGTQFHVYSHTEIRGYIYSNSDITSMPCSGYGYFWVNLSDISFN